jgi:pyruvate carboxylase
MRRALDEFVIEGIKTTIPFHRQLMDDLVILRRLYARFYGISLVMMSYKVLYLKRRTKT